MRLISPTPKQIRELQTNEARYYFSAAFDVVLRKWGYTPFPSNMTESVGFVTRGTAWVGELAKKPLIFEGPLRANVQERLSIDVTEQTSAKLALGTTQEDLSWTLTPNRARVRCIPQRRGELSDPETFECRDEAWNVSEIEFHSIQPRRGQKPVLFARDDDGQLHIVGVAIADAIVLGIPALDFIVQHYAVPPYHNAYYDMSTEPELLGLERWLLKRACELHLACGGAILRTEMWPVGTSSALTIRHDFDRPIEDRLFKSNNYERLLRRYSDLGVLATWFWRECTLQRNQMRRAVQRGHEIALHTEAKTEKAFEEESRAVAREAGTPVLGYSAHGGLGAAGYLGLHQLEWATNQRMLYGEHLGTRTRWPTASIMIKDGIPSIGRLVMPSLHWSLDGGTKPEAHHLDLLRVKSAAALEQGEHLVIMNHPDIHVDELLTLVDGLDLDSTWCATLQSVAQWTLSTKLSVRAGGDARHPMLEYDNLTPKGMMVTAMSDEGAVTRQIPEGARRVLWNGDGIMAEDSRGQSRVINT